MFCFEFQIEEEIEEITEEYHENEHLPTTSSRSVTKSGPWLSAAPSMHSVDCILAELNSQQVDKKNGVPFPEFGVDIILHHRESKLSYIFTEFPSGPSIPFFSFADSDFSTETSSSSSSSCEEDSQENGMLYSLYLTKMD